MSAVTLQIDGAIATLTLENAEKYNALTTAMLRDLNTHCDTLEHSNVRAVILTGADEKAFCSGADIIEWAQLTPRDFARHWVRLGHRVFDRIARLPMPVIGALNGHAMGGGLELAACCDLRVMTPRATLALPETGIGIVPGWSGTQRLAQQLPPAVLKEMALAGRRIGSDRALALGLVNEVAEDARAAAHALASEIASRAPDATEVAKTLIAAAYDEDTDAALEALGGWIQAGSSEKSEGVAAFAEKRDPRFGDDA
ncbi:enoyl-CoA hydratase/isomerase family protein [Tropicimonas sp. S265A]|uniref:enoyl-CoA hydratase/isomerase family protein n=1 Tax=Tropicimonas sp. S265A TaxID=3415134 RepID=UPI003C7EC51A